MAAMGMRRSAGGEKNAKGKKGLKKKAAKQLHAKEEIQVVEEGKPKVVQRVLLGLFETGDVELPGIGTVADDPDLDDFDDAFDGDLPMDDADEPLLEIDTDISFRDRSTPFIRDAFEIVISRRSGEIVFEAPENDWAAARGMTPGATDLLREFSGRMRAYSKIAECLGKLFCGGQAFADCRLAGALRTESEFAKAIGCDAGVFSRYLKNARLVSGDRSLPLRALFRR